MVIVQYQRPSDGTWWAVKFEHRPTRSHRYYLQAAGLSLFKYELRVNGKLARHFSATRDGDTLSYRRI